MHECEGLTLIKVVSAQVRVLYDYVASEPGAISLRAGEVCSMLDIKEAGWCTLHTNTDKEGYFPVAYCEFSLTSRSQT